MKILFFGTPIFAEIVLKGLVENGFNVVGVVCQEDKPAGRGNKLTSPHIVSLAKEMGLPVYQFVKLKDHIEDFKNIDYQIAVTASYGRILPKAFLDLKPCINVHPSLLPKYRGATPIQNAILNGDKVTGVTIMKTEVGMDDGDIFLQEKVEIRDDDDYTSLLPRLADKGLELLIKTLKNLENGTAKRIPQDNSKAIYVNLLKKEDGLLDFSFDAQSLVNKVRAFCEFPVAFFSIGGEKIRVFKATVAQTDINANVGEIIPNKKRFLIQTVNGVFEILKCQIAGGKILDAKSFLNGYRFKSMVVDK